MYFTLLMAGFLWPSEAAIHGQGLHLVTLWLLTAAWEMISRPSFTSPLAGRQPMRRGQLCVVVGLALVIAGYWVSTWHVFRVNGDRRAALNLAFAWTGIGAIGFLTFRLSTVSQLRSWLATALIGIAVGVTVYGIWQQGDLYGSEAARYRDQRAQLDAALDRTTGNPLNAALLQEQFQTRGIPLSGTERQQFENRLLRSSEIFGTFALANTLGGFLAVAFVMLAGECTVRLRETQTFSRWSWFVMFTLGLVLLAGMVLTKSRTAWLAACVGLTVVFLRGRSVKVTYGARRIVILLALVTGIGGALGIATGSLDKEVILESPRSLQYRLFYWSGTLGVVREAPVFGSGPGNFRQLYVKYKAVESSEAILDPHNIVLDLWCSAGVLGLAGGLIIVFGVLSGPGDGSNHGSKAAFQHRPCYDRKLLLAAFVAGFALHVTGQWLLGMNSMHQELRLAVIPAAAILSCLALSRSIVVDSFSWAAAFLTLFIHLQGAGGMHISIVAALLAILAVMATRSHVECSINPEPWRRRSVYAIVTCCTAVTVVYWGLIPVLSSGFWVQHGEARQQIHDLSAAETAFEKAARADPLSPVPRQRQAALSAYQLQRIPGMGRAAGPENRQHIAAAAKSAIQACERLISSDARSYSGYYQRALTHLALAEAKVSERAMDSAINDLKTTTQMYPTNSIFWCQYAHVLEANGRTEDAISAANRALQIDDVNHDWGHSDRFLNSELRQSMEVMVSQVAAI